VGVGTSVWWYPHCLRAELVAKGVYCDRQSARWIRGLAVPHRRQNPRVCQRDTVHREDAALVRFWLHWLLTSQVSASPLCAAAGLRDHQLPRVMRRDAARQIPCFSTRYCAQGRCCLGLLRLGPFAHRKGIRSPPGPYWHYDLL
jgi:hypothetical protein